MQNPRLAARYAKSLMGLAIERNQLEEVYKDCIYMQQLCKLSAEFVALLKSPVIKADKKLAILNGVTEGKVSELTVAFNRLLVNKGRENVLPEVLVAFIDQYKSHKGIFPVKLTSAVAVSESAQEAIRAKVQEFIPGKQIELNTAVNEELIGGFQLELGNTLVDASIAYDLNKIRSQFMKNDFVYKIR
jgi:F-type H+-transporting ATPase subunit delta